MALDKLSWPSVAILGIPAGVQDIEAHRWVIHTVFCPILTLKNREYIKWLSFYAIEFWYVI